jgi:hypothetical protein
VIDTSLIPECRGLEARLRRPIPVMIAGQIERQLVKKKLAT